MKDKKEKQLTDTIVLSFGHSMVTSAHEDRSQVGRVIANIRDKKNIEEFGLFYDNLAEKFYQESEDSLSTKPSRKEDSEFITPTFRLLSNTTVSKEWMPTYFTEGALKRSMNLLVGQTVYKDHVAMVDNAIGSVQEVYWQDAYTTSDGIEIPAGINGVLKIDAKANPRIARALTMNPPAIHSNSVTVRFKWEPSHKDMEFKEFCSKIGQYDDEGNLYQRVVTDVVAYAETSLVWNGADPFAKKIGEDGHIILPESASATASILSMKSQFQLSNGGSLTANLNGQEQEVLLYDMYDFKSLSQAKYHDTNFNNTKQLQQMDEQQFNQLVESLAANGIEVQGQATPETVISSVASLKAERDKAISDLAELQDKLNKSNEDVEKLKAEIHKNSKFVELGMESEQSLRNEAMENYTKLMGEKVDDSILATLKDETTSYSVVKALNSVYKQSLEDKFPMSCQECGSHNISRSSSVSAAEEIKKDEESLTEGQSVNETLKSVINKQKQS